MIELGILRIANSKGVPFAREKLRACLVAAGVKKVAAGQIVSLISENIRTKTPVIIDIFLEESLRSLIIQSPAIETRYNQIELPHLPNDEDLKKLREILSFLTREELLHDLELKVEERTNELKIEREKSEKLLRNMLPEKIATRMKHGETIADHHEASVVFIDIVGFTEFARDRSASSVVNILDAIFREFDLITKKHGLEKIKTIGDGYLAVAGIPEPQYDHVDRAVLMGLNIVTAVSKLKVIMNVPVDVRIGIHTGPVLAGVIGINKPFYDIWGDTVNVASRLEKYGEKGRVHISDDLKVKLGKRFKFHDCGIKDIKNRGKIRTWTVTLP